MPCAADSRDGEERRKELDITTRLSCIYLKEREAYGLPIPDFAVEWWEGHKRYDAWRRARGEIV